MMNVNKEIYIIIGIIVGLIIKQITGNFFIGLGIFVMLLIIFKVVK